METILQTKVSGLVHIAEVINKICGGDNSKDIYRSRFDVPLTKNLWFEGDPNRVSMLSARVVVSEHSQREEILVLKISRKPKSFDSGVSRPAGFGDEMTLYSESREIALLPDFVIVDESSYPKKIDFHALDLSNVPSILIKKSIGRDSQLYIPEENRRIKEEISKLRTKAYARIEVF